MAKPVSMLLGVLRRHRGEHQSVYSPIQRLGYLLPDRPQPGNCNPQSGFRVLRQICHSLASLFSYARTARLCATVLSEGILTALVPGESPPDRKPACSLGSPATNRPKYDLLLLAKIGFSCLSI